MPAGLRYGVEVRSAVAADAAEIARMLGAAGLPLTPGEAALRLEALRGPAASALVATGYNGLSGVVATGWAPVLQAARPVAAITLLLVDLEERRRGIGRLLLKAASQAARAAGCDRMVWAMPAVAPEAEAFCLATGFVRDGAAFGRSLRRRG